jgi:hypothetical protein
MEYYKKINIEKYDVIVSKIKLYLESKELVDTVHTGFIPLHPSEVIRNCLELQFSLNSIGLKIKSIGIYRTTRNNQSPVHIDHTPYKSRLNIPIMNCQGSSTVFYEAEIEQVKQQNNFDIKYIRCVNAVEVDRVTVDQPTILRIDHPHQVIMDETRSPRICLTVGCDLDPMSMFATK